jgi:hypothetical protein
VKRTIVLGVLAAILLAMPGYYRHRQAVDHFALGIWGEVEGVWQHFTFESKKLGSVIAGAFSGKGSGKTIPSQREAEAAAVRESQKQIDEQEKKETTGEDGGAADFDKLREFDPKVTRHIGDDAKAEPEPGPAKPRVPK